MSALFISKVQNYGSKVRKLEKRGRERKEELILETKKGILSKYPLLFKLQRFNFFK